MIPTLPRRRRLATVTVACDDFPMIAIARISRGLSLLRRDAESVLRGERPL